MSTSGSKKVLIGFSQYLNVSFRHIFLSIVSQLRFLVFFPLLYLFSFARTAAGRTEDINPLCVSIFFQKIMQRCIPNFQTVHVFQIKRVAFVEDELTETAERRLAEGRAFFIPFHNLLDFG